MWRDGRERLLNRGVRVFQLGPAPGGPNAVPADGLFEPDAPVALHNDIEATGGTAQKKASAHAADSEPSTQGWGFVVGGAGLARAAGRVAGSSWIETALGAAGVPLLAAVAAGAVLLYPRSLKEEGVVATGAGHDPRMEGKPPVVPPKPPAGDADPVTEAAKTAEGKKPSTDCESDAAARELANQVEQALRGLQELGLRDLSNIQARSHARDGGRKRQLHRSSGPLPARPSNLRAQ